MKQFLVLYLAPIAEREAMMATKLPSDVAVTIAHWQHWKAAHRAALIDASSPVGKAQSATRQGINPQKNEVDAYAIVQAASLKEAMQLFPLHHPHFSFPVARVEAMEIVSPAG